jgi:ATP synthase protein I
MGLVVTVILAVPSAGLATAVRGGSGAAGAVLGTAVVALFFTMSKVVVALVARRARELLLPAVLGTYAVKIVLLGVLAATITDVDAVDAFSLAGAVSVGVFGWVGAELWVATHTRVPFFEPEPYSQHVGTQNVGTQNVGTQHVGTQNVGTQHVGTQHVGTQNVGTHGIASRVAGDPTSRPTGSPATDLRGRRG